MASFSQLIIPVTSAHSFKADSKLSKVPSSCHLPSHR
ncbi:hypothetical protein NEOC65_001031 [Neochlamydia sp. AcF65]|nr:hypothetical protein [Neochlamydia sp. AcF65]